jgi:hypothetical protein
MGASMAGTGKPGERKVWTRVESQSQTRSKCAFCDFVLILYPLLKGMTSRDQGTFTDHLRKSHGLKEEISP